MFKKAFATILTLGMFLFVFTGMVTAQQDVFDEPVLELHKIPTDHLEPLDSGAIRGAIAGMPSTIMMNSFAMELDDWENQNCSQQYSVRTDVRLVWGAYFYLTTDSPIYVKFRLRVTGPESLAYDSWHGEALDAGYYVAIIKNGVHRKFGVYSVKLDMWPENGEVTFWSKEWSKYEVVD